MIFYLGTHETNWLNKTGVPLFISHRRLAKRKKFPIASTEWALDSGGFSELSMFGEWLTNARDYAEAVRRYSQEIGKLKWAASQDWMCEPFILQKTGKTVLEHQKLTIENFQELKAIAPEINFVPVIQGWLPSDYENHIELYDKAGIDLRSNEVVGIGSVCRRQSTTIIQNLVRRICNYGINLHGFGVKVGGLKNISQSLVSADSMAWSFGARLKQPLPGCKHKSCSNCLKYAEKWYFEIIESLKPKETNQMSLF